MICLIDKKYCTGCMACYNVCKKNAIIFRENAQGFYFPEVLDDKCVECGLCINSCPIQSINLNANNTSSPKVYAVKNHSELTRSRSTSGGAFSAISDYILANKGVIYGTILDDNYKVRYSRAITFEERDKMCGVKYVQSYLGDIHRLLQEDVSRGKKVLFVGTPCYLDGVKHLYKEKVPENLILCDLICHGSPSPLIFQDHVKYIEKKGKVSQYRFRDKTFGWRGTNTTISYGCKTESNTPLSDIFTNLYFDGFISRESCASCKYTSTNRVGDITIGDFWGIEKYHKEFNDEKGVSLVIVNTPKGCKIFEEIEDSVDYLESSMEFCLQPQMQYPAKANRRKSQFWSDYMSRGFQYCAKKYTVLGLSNRIIKFVKRLIPNHLKDTLKRLMLNVY